MQHGGKSNVITSTNTSLMFPIERRINRKTMLPTDVLGVGETKVQSYHRFCDR
jgi:hypothetical protein